MLKAESVEVFQLRVLNEAPVYYKSRELGLCLYYRRISEQLIIWVRNLTNKNSEAYYLLEHESINWPFWILKFLWLPWNVFWQIFKVIKFWWFLSDSGQFSAEKCVSSFFEFQKLIGWAVSTCLYKLEFGIFMICTHFLTENRPGLLKNC